MYATNREKMLKNYRILLLREIFILNRRDLFIDKKRKKKSIIDEDEIFKSLLKLYLLMYSYFKININQ